MQTKIDMRLRYYEKAAITVTSDIYDFFIQIASFAKIW